MRTGLGHSKLVPRLKKLDWERDQVVHVLQLGFDVRNLLSIVHTTVCLQRSDDTCPSKGRKIQGTYVCGESVVVMLNWRWVSHTVAVVLAVLVPLSLLCPTSPTVTECQSELLADTPEMDSELDLDQSFTEHPSDGDYVQSPVKRPKRALMPLGNKVFIGLFH